MALLSLLVFLNRGGTAQPQYQKSINLDGEREMANREVVLFLDNLIRESPIQQCRICHEEEDESSNNLEAPCSCSGSVKFAHRDCIQRWCNEKGNTICELCLEKYEPGYMYIVPAPKKEQLYDVTVAVSASLEVPRENRELYNSGLMAIVAAYTDDDDDDDDDDEDNQRGESNYAKCSTSVERSVSFCRSLAITFCIYLLVQHFLAVITSGEDEYAFTLATLFLLRAAGILVPMYIMIRILTTIQNSLCTVNDQESLQLHGRNQIQL